MRYTAVIRTLGTAGDKYQRELDSLRAQTMPPEEIIVYIAEGYPLPEETCGKERYVYVKKGMIAQRALQYDEVDTEWILFLDDDVYLPTNGVEQLFNAVDEYGADVISPDVFDNASRSLKSEILMTVSGRMRARRGDRKWGYKVMRTAGYSYNKVQERGIFLSQSNAGPCGLCRKADFLKIRFADELWLDKMGYPIGEDQIMYYKMYLSGLKVMTLYGSGIEHLDAGGNLGNKEKEQRVVGADYFFRRVFFDRFILKPERNVMKRLWSRICIGYFYAFGLTVSSIKGEKEVLRIKCEALRRANEFLKSETYRKLPLIEKKI
ncbi:MAG: glycosyltransferase [Muribaculum sp.]|nr:glycosyltransferase [Muribaculum sp.]